MGRRKVTTIGRDIFGNKKVVTEWVEDGGGCGALLVVGFILYLLARGCH